MIIDTLANISRYIGVLPQVVKVESVLKSVDWNTIAEGQYKTDDPSVRYNVFSYDTPSPVSEKAEYHEKEIDLQIIISGEERMDLSPAMNDKVILPYSAEKDAGFVANDRNIEFYATPGFFAVFFPHEPHAPSLKAVKQTRVKKVVFKLLA